MIQKYYGHTYREKYRRITRGLPLESDLKFRVIEEGIFTEFINESVLTILFRMSTAVLRKWPISRLSSMHSTSSSRNIVLFTWEMDSSSPGQCECSSR